LKVTRGLKSFSLYRVRKDLEVFIIDLQLAGVELRKSTSRYSGYFRLLSRLVKEYGFKLDGLENIDYVCRTQSQEGKPRTTFLLRVYLSPQGKAEYVAIASFRPRSLRAVEEKLLSSGWKRLFHIGILVEKVRPA